VFFPYKAEANVATFPVSNILIIVITCLLYLSVVVGLGNENSFILDSWSIDLISYGFMHGSVIHLLFNMYYLLLFGNAVCSNIGNATFPIIYFILVILSGAFHYYIEGTPVIGASGAVFGVIGLYLFLYPRSLIRCIYTTRFNFGQEINIKAYWLITFWFLSNLLCYFLFKGQIAYLAHLGGLFIGIFLGYLLFKYSWLKRESSQPNLAQLLSGS
jgi:membrane associated rhomboid family serine protease